MFFNEKAQDSLIIGLKNRFDLFINTLDGPTCEKISPIYKEEKRSFFNELKEKSPLFAEKVVHMLNKSLVSEIIEDEDLDGLSLKEDMNSLIVVNKKEDTLFILPFAGKASKLIMDENSEIDFPILLGEENGELFKNKLSNLIRTNESRLSSVLNDIKNELEIFKIKLFLKRHIRIESLKKMNVKNEIKEINNIRFSYGMYYESFLISEWSEIKIKNNFNNNLNKIFNFNDDKNLEYFKNNALRLNELLSENFQDRAEVDYDNMFFNVQEKTKYKLRPNVYIHERLEDKNIEWFLFPDFENSFENLNNLDIYCRKCESYEKEDAYFKTDFKHLDYVNNKLLFLKNIESIIFKNE